MRAEISCTSWTSCGGRRPWWTWCWWGRRAGWRSLGTSCSSLLALLILTQGCDLNPLASEEIWLIRNFGSASVNLLLEHDFCNWDLVISIFFGSTYNRCSGSVLPGKERGLPGTAREGSESRLASHSENFIFYLEHFCFLKHESRWEESLRETSVPSLTLCTMESLRWGMIVSLRKGMIL